MRLAGAVVNGKERHRPTLFRRRTRRTAGPRNNNTPHPSQTASRRRMRSLRG
ncbi:MAG: hypothetical protein BLITH_0998 [Brockia lithotrophica]|uniref:Uncharacterized protein n=1 Tax=Brockia lithotrophica TaxID=933949 RepID=A0A2T5G761_9BACL|nr:MAG: hypothetical protein BLITH_0998 [Brockia lithotrophica]